MHCSQQSLPLLGSILMNVFRNFATIVRKWKSKRFAKFNLFCEDFLKVPKRTRLFIVQFIFASAFLLASHIVEVKQLARHAHVVERPALTARHAGRAIFSIFSNVLSDSHPQVYDFFKFNVDST